MSAMTATLTSWSAQPAPTPPPTGPPPLHLMNWMMWGVFGFSVAVMAVVLVMLVTASGRRYLGEKKRKDPGHNIKVVVGLAVCALFSGAALSILQVVSP